MLRGEMLRRICLFEAVTQFKIGGYIPYAFVYAWKIIQEFGQCVGIILLWIEYLLISDGCIQYAFIYALRKIPEFSQYVCIKILWIVALLISDNPSMVNNRKNIRDKKKENKERTREETKTESESFLEDLGLQQFYSNKLSLSEVQQIDQRTVSDDSTQNLSDVPWIFLKKLMLVNVTARSVKCGSSSQTDSVEDLDLLDLIEDSSSAVNPLDIITAVFLCSDSFLQQELTYKMSLCQFSVPFILPDCEKQQNILMLWALRDIVKKFKPHSLSDPRGFVEERMVQFDLPLFSFVRFGECSISKSQILNLMLSNPQQNHNTFIYRNMDCGNIQRRISDGLVEISWYLPCGKKNIDIFPEALAVTNLRGDIRDFEAQFSFLCRVSTAVFIFCDDLKSDSQFLTKTHGQAQRFLVCDVQTKYFNMDLLKKTASEMNLKKNNIILKNKQNESDLVNRICSVVTDVITNNPVTVQLEKMSAVAHDLGILIDEENTECKSAKDRVYEITRKIKTTYEFKKAQLPLQGEVWKKLSKLEKEECRLRKAGNKSIEIYKSELNEKKKKLRKQQSSYEISETMTLFLAALACSPLERSYFLKWMRMNLDDLSRKHLSALREEYKMKYESSGNKKEIKELDERISNSALGTEHFLRELGQWYEAAVSLPENSEQRKQMEHLPRLCAQLLLDGFPLELVDGDASNIPLRWVTDVLKELNTLVEGRNKIRVVTVLGVQSTGKSTLLNTMFGVQFAVSSGRCTRGAFMLLIKVSDNNREDLNCDYLMIIDTEGLKSPELSQLDDSYEHDNELATLVVGLSDITIINIAMETSTEMKDILQIVVHAFLRMKEVGKKPVCVFVHQNVADVSAHEKIRRTRNHKLLLEQLDEMTEAAAKMENKDEYKKFTDVINYNQESGNWYIPGLWNGNPPMAPVNSGYSESVYDFKKNMMNLFMKYKTNTRVNNILDFLKWTTSLWRSVKYENFSFRNSLVADAYMNLCTVFNKWEWTFKKSMHTWSTEAETRISNFEILKTESDKSNLQDLLQKLKKEAMMKLDEQEKAIMEHLCKYFEQKEGHVYLVEKYREDFKRTTESLRKEIERSVLNNLETVTEISAAKNKLDNIKKTYTDKMEQEVRELLKEIQKKTGPESLSEEELTKVFEEMWKKTVKELSFEGLMTKNLHDRVLNQVRENLKEKGSSVSETLNSISLHQVGRETFTVTNDHIEKEWGDHLTHKFDNGMKLQELQQLSDSIIRSCDQSIKEKIGESSDFNENHIQEILQIIDEELNSERNLKFSEHFELSLKLHICGICASEFQNSHERFNEENDPRRCLEKFKNLYCTDFKDLFYNRDQCQKKAEDFTQLCLKPAVETFIYSRLGPEFMDVMQQGDEGRQFSTRTFFQFSILQDLLKEEKFQNYVRYIRSYEEFVKNWISEQVLFKFKSKGNKVSEEDTPHINTAVTEITEVIKETQKTKKTESIKCFIYDLCSGLGKTLIIQRDALDAVIALSNANQEQFADWLIQSVQEMEVSLKVQFKEEDIQNKLSQLSVKPQDELFKRVFGCGKLCPFCKVPCEAGGADHREHRASVHRPKGLGRYRWEDSKKLVVDICSTAVQSEVRFSCRETNNDYHPYKDYRKIFPDWDIYPDHSIEASDYWKYVLMKFNHQFAKEYNAEPADIPPAWENITKEQAEKSLKETFGFK